jgi:hypothetical protein
MRFPPMPVRSTGRIVFTWRPARISWFRMAPSCDLVPEARQFTRKVLSGCDADFVDDAELVTSELVTNSIKYALSHGEPPKHVVPGIWLGVQALKRYVHLRVRDPYPVLPRKRVATETETSGRGLPIVEALTVAYWVDPRTYDKTMHAIVGKPGAVFTEDELDRLRR